MDIRMKAGKRCSAFPFMFSILPLAMLIHYAATRGRWEHASDVPVTSSRIRSPRSWLENSSRRTGTRGKKVRRRLYSSCSAVVLAMNSLLKSARPFCASMTGFFFLRELFYVSP